MKCRDCGAANDNHRRFCRQCGQGLGVPCPRCAFFNDHGDGFCGGCGARLSQATEQSAPALTTAKEISRASLPADALDEIFGSEAATPAPSIEPRSDQPATQSDIDNLFNKLRQSTDSEASGGETQAP